MILLEARVQRKYNPICLSKMVKTVSEEGKVSFSFGENWLNYIESLDVEKYKEAKQSLQNLLGLSSLKGKSFLDVGCGSGILSLAAIELGAERVISIDVDSKSVEACEQLKQRINNPANWIILEGSILDRVLVNKLEKSDVVYSWGVLHHTGAMWQAIDQVSNLVKDNGLLAIAIYNHASTSNFWLKFKRFYNKSGELTKIFMVWSIFLPRVIVRILKLKHPLREKRGMSVYYDAIDWVGGLPYEFASFEEVQSYVENKGFTLVNSKRTNSIGCNEFVFKKTKADEN